MEKKTLIRKDDMEIQEGYFIELDCCLCHDCRILVAPTKKELAVLIKDEGWKILNSDLLMLIGHYCGCNYKD